MERFTRVKLFPGYRWPTKEMPVQMLRAAQIRDTKTGCNYLQIKWQNESNLVIDYMKIRVECMIASGKAEGGLTLEELLFEYTEQSFPAGEAFGDKQPIRLPWEAVDSIVAKPVEIAFHSGETWHVGSGWRSLRTGAQRAPQAQRQSAQPARPQAQSARPVPPQAKSAQSAPPQAQTVPVQPQWQGAAQPAQAAQAPQAQSVPQDAGARRKTLVSPYETDPDGPGEQGYDSSLFRKRRTALGWVLRIAAIAVIALLVAGYVLYGREFMAYWNARRMLNAGNYEDAVTAFSGLDGYLDSDALLDQAEEQLRRRRYDAALIQLRAGNYLAAAQQFELLGDYEDSAQRLQEANSARWQQEYEEAISLYNAGKYEEALQALHDLDGYADSAERISQCEIAIAQAGYQRGRQLFNEGSYAEARAQFIELGDYLDSAQWAEACGKLTGQQTTLRAASAAAATPPPTGGAASASPDGVIGTVTCTGGGTNLRAQPSTASEVVGSLKNGDVLLCAGLSADGGWYQVLSADGTTAYVAAKRVQFNGAASAATAASTNLSTAVPTPIPTAAPTSAPTAAPTTAPTNAPTSAPTSAPTAAPTTAPTGAPTTTPVAAATTAPTTAPTAAPVAVTTSAPLTASTSAAKPSALKIGGWNVVGFVECISDGATNLRAQPSLDSTIVSVARKGDVFSCIDMSNRVWYQVVLSDGRKAYIAKSRVSFTDAAQAASDATANAPVAVTTAAPTTASATAPATVPAAAPTAAPTAAPQAQSVSDGAMGTVTVIGDMGGAVRGGDSADAPILLSLDKGEKLDCYGISEQGWYEVKTEDGATAYISPKQASFSAR